MSPILCVTRHIGIDPYHSAALLSLRRIKALFLHGKPRPDANSVNNGKWEVGTNVWFINTVYHLR